MASGNTKNSKKISTQKLDNLPAVSELKSKHFNQTSAQTKLNVKPAAKSLFSPSINKTGKQHETLSSNESVIGNASLDQLREEIENKIKAEYTKIQEERNKSVEAKISKYKIRADLYEEKNGNLEKQITELTQENSNITVVNQKLRNEIDGLRKHPNSIGNVEHLNQELSNIRAFNENLIHKVNALENSKNDLNYQLVENSKRIANLTDNNTRLTRKIEHYEAQKSTDERLNNVLDELKQTVKEKDTQLIENKKLYITGTHGIQARIDALASDLDNYRSYVVQIKGEKSQLSSHVDQLSLECKTLKEQLKLSDTELSKTKTELEQSKFKFSTDFESFETRFNTELGNKDKEIAELKAEMERLTADNTRLNKFRTDIKNAVCNSEKQCSSIPLPQFREVKLEYSDSSQEQHRF